MKIGILQTGIVLDELQSTYGDYAHHFELLLEGRGFEFQVYKVVYNEFPKNADECDGWIITGSRHGVYEDHSWIPVLEDLIRSIFAADIPIVGICFGHQIIAQAMGGRVEKYAGGWAIGTCTYRSKTGENLTLNAYHQDQVTRLPKTAEVLMGNSFCKYAMLRYGKKALTLQPHPEYSTAYIRDLINAHGRVFIDKHIVENAYEQLSQDLDTTRAADQISDFFHHHI